MTIPSLMVFLSLTLKAKPNRRANLSTGIFFVAFDLIFFVLFLGAFSYETFWSIVYPVFPILVVWYAWKWPKQEA